MTTVDFTPLIKKTVENQDFGSKLIAFARAHGVELVGGEELSEDQLGDVAGGVSFQIHKHALTYAIKEAPAHIQFYPGEIW